ncbi:hypothetical protein [Desulforamulus ruminis]|uniref:hypothetical protein n=1 Tax=Desulforamulus ruminis TaxID=1564 RepID=UPI0023542709|nr:hypothetical protein [Desulforamulus ruminis]
MFDKIKDFIVPAFLTVSVVIFFFIALVMFKDNLDIAKQLITAVIAGFTALTTFYFTKHNTNG